MRAADLKKSILQMAVEGKLVEQDPADEPASALLDRIRAERARLIKDKKIKAPKGGESVIYRNGGSWYERRGKSDPVCIDDEIPFDIPDSWEWARMSVLARMVSGTSFKKGDITNKGIRVIRGGNIEVPKVVLKDDDVFLDVAFADDEKTLQSGDIVIVASTGSSTAIGRPGFVSEAMPSVQIGAFLRIVRTVASGFVYWNQLIFTSDYYRARIRELAKGTNINNVKESYVMDMLVPISPLAEQRRIVERVDGLMPLVEEYGRLEDVREALDSALPDRLRKSILQMAVEGKLVEQDPADEPASVLLDRIRAERARLVKEKKIKASKGGESVIYRDGGSWYERRGKSAPVCIDDEIPFDIPDSWEWVRLWSVGELNRGRSQARPRNDPSLFLNGTFPMIQTGDVARAHNGHITEWSTAYNEKGVAQSRVWPKGTVCLTIAANIGDSAILDFDACFPDSVVGFIAYSPINTNEFFMYGLMSYKDYLDKKSYSTAQKNINLAVLSGLVFPLPPLLEQHRIAVRIKMLFDSIDSLIR